jgi:hypothetical protein
MRQDILVNRQEGILMNWHALVLPWVIGGSLFGLVILSLQTLYMMKLRSSFETRFGQIISSGVLLCWLTYIPIAQYFHLSLLLFIPYIALVAIIIVPIYFFSIKRDIQRIYENRFSRDRSEPVFISGMFFMLYASKWKTHL